jgi:putative Mn2+ efflux pump MntP
MPVVGLLLGHSLSQDLGAASDPIAGTLLGLAGTYVIVTELVDQNKSAPSPKPSTKHLVLLAAALSVDNLVIGFALGAYHVNLVLAAVTIAAVSVALSLLGLEIGRRVGSRLGQRSELVGGAVLIMVGVAIGIGLI